jgi:hypothetical protein
MEKYILFIIDYYYPSGWLSDIEDSFDSLYKAKEIEKEIMKNRTCSESYIVDRDTWEKIL